MAENNMDLLAWLRKQLAEAGPDLLREMVRTFAESLMGAEADALCGAAFRERSGERVNHLAGDDFELDLSGEPLRVVREN